MDSMVSVQWTVWDNQDRIVGGELKGNANAGSWSDEEISVFLGGFEARKNQPSVIELDCKLDGGLLKQCSPFLLVRRERPLWCL